MTARNRALEPMVPRDGLVGVEAEKRDTPADGAHGHWRLTMHEAQRQKAGREQRGRWQTRTRLPTPWELDGSG